MHLPIYPSTLGSTIVPTPSIYCLKRPLYMAHYDYA